VQDHLENEDIGSGYWNTHKAYSPRPAVTRKPMDKLAIVQASTVEEAILATKVVTSDHATTMTTCHSAPLSFEQQVFHI
jgi:hypothetical protein